MMKHINMSSSKNRKRTILKYPTLYNVKFVLEENQFTMCWESEENKGSRNNVPQRLTENNCQKILSEDGESVLISCCELEDNELNIGVSKRSFTTSQQELLAVCFIRYPNPPFRDMALQISQRSVRLKNESVDKIKKWFEYVYKTFKIGKHPGWAFDPDTKEIRYQAEIDQDGMMRIYKSYSVNDIKFRGNYSKSTPHEGTNEETDQNRNRKINRDSDQEYVAWSAKKSTDSTTIPITPIIKQEPVDYEAEQPKLPSDYKIPKLPNLARFPHSVIPSSQIKKENESLCIANANQPSKLSLQCYNQFGDESESSSKNKSFGGADSQRFTTNKQTKFIQKRSPRKRRNRRKPFRDGDIPQIVELRTTVKRRQQMAAKARQRALFHQKWKKQ